MTDFKADIPDFFAGFFEWLGTAEGETSLQAVDAVTEYFEEAELDLKTGKSSGLMVRD